MKSFAVAGLMMLAVAGCGSQRVVHELTPIEEYALAQQIRLIELEDLRRFEQISEDEPQRAVVIAKAQERFDRAKQLCNIAENRLVASMPK